jgi:hypothetical protein
MQYVTFLLSRSDASASTASLPDIDACTQKYLRHQQRQYIPLDLLMLIRFLAGDSNDGTRRISFGPGS